MPLATRPRTHVRTWPGTTHMQRTPIRTNRLTAVSTTTRIILIYSQAGRGCFKTIPFPLAALFVRPVSHNHRKLHPQTWTILCVKIRNRTTVHLCTEAYPPETVTGFTWCGPHCMHENCTQHAPPTIAHYSRLPHTIQQPS